jgi:hypothetical protein
MTNNVIHVPEDVIDHQTGVETLNAFVYVICMHSFRNHLWIHRTSQTTVRCLVFHFYPN